MKATYAFPILALIFLFSGCASTLGQTKTIPYELSKQSDPESSQFEESKKEIEAEVDSNSFDLGVQHKGLLGPGKANKFGPGIHSDATGKPFVWKTKKGEIYRSPVKENAYGLGVGMDEYGRPVRAKPYR